jgi:hypothetical protein
MKMSAELKSMLETPRTGPLKPSNRFGECFDTPRHVKLWRAANRRLAKAGAFAPREELDVVIPAELIGTHGLRPSWHGRA